MIIFFLFVFFVQIFLVRLRLLGVLVLGELLLFLTSLFSVFFMSSGMVVLIIISISACLVTVGICVCAMFFRGFSSNQTVL